MGHDDTRGKGASDSPKPADDLDSAFDFIDDTMKEVARREVTVTPEALEQIVNDAVAKAITAYEARGVAPSQPTKPAAEPLSPSRAKLEQLQGDMGLDEIEFDSPAATPAGPETAGHGTLSKQMGVHDFQFDDVPGAAAEPDAHAPLDIDDLTEWINTSGAAADVNQLRATAGGKARTREGEQEFDWVAAELAALDAAETGIAADPPAAAPRDPEPPPYEAPAPAPPAIEQPRGPSTPEVRETRSGLAGWFRSALGDKLPQPEPARVPEPTPRQPEPEVEAPVPVAAQPEERPRPTPEPAAALKPTTAAEAADTIRFTFDPIPPVPPRLPRESNEPPKKINKSGRFL
jgi:hypothetical protein